MGKATFLRYAKALYCCSSTLSKDDKARLWSMGVLCIKTPVALVNTVSFYNGIVSILRDEYDELRAWKTETMEN